MEEKSSHSYPSVFFDFYKKADIFGYRIELSLQGNKFVKSKFGATLSLLIIATTAYFFYLSILDWSKNSKLQTISSVRSSSVPQIINKNLSSFYDFNYENYNIYFALIGQIPNKATLNHQQLKRYFTQTVSLGPKTIELEPCNIAKQNIFLLDSDSNTKNGDKNTSNWSLCLKDPFTLGYRVDNITGGVYNPSLMYLISKCQNSTENNFSCASDAEINDIIKYTHIQVSIPQNIYDFTDPVMARKRIYDNQFYIFENSMIKLYMGKLVPIQVQLDTGFLYENFEIDSLDFKLEGDVQYQSTLRDNNQPLFQYNLQISYNSNTYYRKNIKFMEMLANLGGTVNILMILGRIICLSYNAHVLRHKLINYSFENLDVDNKNKK